MSKIIIIDDEPLARSIVKEYLEKYPQLELMAECGDGFEGVKAIQQHQPDLIFLDIQMPKITGFEMLELIEQPPAVIFTTAFDEYAIKAFEAHAIDYLLKPFNQERFDKAVTKWKEESGKSRENKTEDLLETASLSPAQSQRIVVKNGSKIKIIPVHDVFYLEAADDYVKIHTNDSYYLKNKTMAHFEKAMDAQLGKIRIATSISSLLKLKLGDTFRFLVAHQQRHFIQIHNTLQQTGVAAAVITA